MCLFKRMLVICLVIIFVVLLFYVIMVLNTNSIYEYTQQVIKGNIAISDNNPLFYFANVYFANDTKPDGASYSDFVFIRKKVWHNFKSGQFTIVFSENIFDENDNLIHQFKNIEVIIYIEKQNGEWIVTNTKRII